VATKFGQIIRVDEFCIITDLKYVYRNFENLKQTPIWGITHMEIKEFYNSNEFRQNNIPSKIKAAIHTMTMRFISSIKDASKGNTGTTIRNNT